MRLCSSYKSFLWLGAGACDVDTRIGRDGCQVREGDAENSALLFLYHEHGFRTTLQVASLLERRGHLRLLYKKFSAENDHVGFLLDGMLTRLLAARRPNE